MNGTHYVRAKGGMTLLSEAMSRLQLVQFFKIIDCPLYDTLLQQKLKYQELFREESPDPVKIKEEWENVRVCFHVFRMIVKNSRIRDARKVNNLHIGYFYRRNSSCFERFNKVTSRTELVFTFVCYTASNPIIFLFR